MRKQSKNILLDRLHRGAVYTCMGVTLWASYVIGARLYHYFTVVKPARKAEELRMLEAGAGTGPALASTATGQLDTAPTLRS
ncbi:uncharacterized protein LOC129727453 [Wyeomyia smithii]|uniref:uncharacterized protein LOC129727453 n=1 Tax=Wyeomyia smithii TaxID=174621 RepID=UPI002467BBD2|nr:uncharacterized protein LOC129727453 [Wyeomyia smithii]